MGYSNMYKVPRYLWSSIGLVGPEKYGTKRLIIFTFSMILGTSVIFRHLMCNIHVHNTSALYIDRFNDISPKIIKIK